MKNVVTTTGIRPFAFLHHFVMPARKADVLLFHKTRAIASGDWQTTEFTPASERPKGASWYRNLMGGKCKKKTTLFPVQLPVQQHPILVWTALFFGMPCLLTAAVFLLTGILVLPVYYLFEVVL